MNQRRQCRSKSLFSASDNGENLEIPAGSLLEYVTGPLHDEISAGDAARFDISDREVFFEFRGRRLKATWKQFYDLGGCEEI